MFGADFAMGSLPGLVSAHAPAASMPVATSVAAPTTTHRPRRGGGSGASVTRNSTSSKRSCSMTLILRLVVRFRT